MLQPTSRPNAIKAAGRVDTDKARAKSALSFEAKGFFDKRWLRARGTGETAGYFSKYRIFFSIQHNFKVIELVFCFICSALRARPATDDRLNAHDFVRRVFPSVFRTC